MKFSVKLPFKKIVLILLGLFYLFIIVSNLLGNKEGLETISNDETDTSSDGEIPTKENKKSAKSENDNNDNSVEDDSY